MIVNLTGAALGALFNCYRGGIFNNRDELIARIKFPWLKRLVYFVLQGDIVNATAFAAYCVILHPGGVLLFVWQWVMMLRGSAPGWGEYIGAAGGWRPTFTKPLQPEVYYIDKIAHAFTDNKRLWGVIALSLRCGEWGLLIGAPLLNFFPLLAGLCAGPLVFALSKIVPQKYVWKVFEAIFGALLWTSII